LYSCRICSLIRFAPRSERPPMRAGRVYTIQSSLNKVKITGVGAGLCMNRH
jgi:hypothetical protein